ncbi:MAG: precorrin-8X methylmutase [Acidimicrobiales bacterium]
MIHPIERQSYAILASRIDLDGRPPGERSVIERVIHASADIEFATSMVVDERSVTAGIAAFRSGAPVIVDVEMVGAGISNHPTRCYLREATAAEGGFPTRSAMAMRIAANDHPDGAIFVIGCAPTALFEIVDLVRAGSLRPALVVGLPVGFVGAAESKEAARLTARETGLAVITNEGEKGGSAVAAAAFNAIARLSRDSG